MRYGFAIDHRKCIGCHACTVACKSEHDVPVGVFRTWVKYIEKGTFPDTRRYFSVLRCNHCEDAPCVTICPTGALFKRPDGIVDFDPAKCIGCKSCMQACPYDALYIDPTTNTAAKCNYCAHRVDQNLLPACVVVCPEKAIIAGDLDDPLSEISQIISREQITVRKPEQGTRPKVFYIGADEAGLTPEAVSRAQEYMWSQVRPDDRPVEAVQANGLVPGPAEPLVAYDVHHPKPWGWRVATYLWTKSIGSGAMLLAALFLLLSLGSSTDTFDIAAPLIGMVFIAATAALLVADLKRPDRFWYILTKANRTSWLVWGGYILGLAGLVAFLWFVVGAFGLMSGLGNALQIAAIPLALAAAGYTAFLFAQAEGRDYWQSPLVLPHLLAQAVVGGASALLIAGALLGAGWDDLRLLATFLGGGLLAHALFIVAEQTMPPVNAHVGRTVELIARGPYRDALASGVLMLGTIVPLILVVATHLTGAVTPLSILAALSALVGIWTYEHIWVSAGQDVPLS